MAACSLQISATAIKWGLTIENNLIPKSELGRPVFRTLLLCFSYKLIVESVINHLTNQVFINNQQTDLKILLFIKNTNIILV